MCRLAMGACAEGSRWRIRKRILARIWELISEHSSEHSSEHNSEHNFTTRIDALTQRQCKKPSSVTDWLSGDFPFLFWRRTPRTIQQRKRHGVPATGVDCGDRI